MSESYYDLLASFGQKQHIPEERFNRWLKSCRNLNLDETKIQWLIDRAKGVGGSECGAILSQFYGYAVDEDIEDGFKSARDVLKDKLFLSKPFTTPQAERGTALEPFIIEMFEQRYNLADLAFDAEQYQKCRKHKDSPYTVGNIDRGYNLPEGALLIDAKSTTRRYESVPFAHIAQLNQYAEIARSNGLNFSTAATVNLVATEEIFTFLTDLYQKHIKYPDDQGIQSQYRQWRNDIVGNKIPFIKFESTVVKISPELGRTIVQSNERFFNDYVNKGLIHFSESNQILLNDEENEKLNELRDLLVQSTLISKAASTNLKAAELKLNSFLSQLSGDPILEERELNIKRVSSFDKGLALAVLADRGITEQSLSKSTGELDINALVRTIEALGGELTDEHYKKSVSDDSVKAALINHGINPTEFEYSVSYKPSLSRKTKYADFLTSEQISAQDSIAQLTFERVEQVKQDQLQDSVGQEITLDQNQDLIF